MDKGKVNEIVLSFKDILIKNGVAVDNIALFGSALTGRMHEDSDIDMIVISKAFMGRDLFERIKMIGRSEIELIDKYEVPVDILLKTPQEYKNSMMFHSQIVV